jgi:hypothetical protein
MVQARRAELDSVAMRRISSTRLDFLFRPPTIEPIVPGLNSTVHLIRRECQDSLANITRTVPEAQFPGNRKLHRLFASTMVICSAFDLLGKLRFGDDMTVTRTFRLLLTNYGHLSRTDARRIFDARNALMHSFGVRRILPARGKKANRRPPTPSSVRIQLSEATQKGPVVRVGKRRWQVSVPSLYRLMSDVMVAIERDLRLPQTVDRVTQFKRMFRRYGTIRIA